MASKPKIPFKIDEPNLLPMMVCSTVSYDVFYIMSFLNEAWTFDMAYLNYNMKIITKYFESIQIADPYATNIFKYRIRKSFVFKPILTDKNKQSKYFSNILINFKSCLLDANKSEIEVSIDENNIYNIKNFKYFNSISDDGFNRFLSSGIIKNVLDKNAAFKSSLLEDAKKRSQKEGLSFSKIRAKDKHDVINLLKSVQVKPLNPNYKLIPTYFYFDPDNNDTTTKKLKSAVAEEIKDAVFDYVKKINGICNIESFDANEMVKYSLVIPEYFEKSVSVLDHGTYFEALMENVPVQFRMGVFLRKLKIISLRNTKFNIADDTLLSDEVSTFNITVQSGLEHLSIDNAKLNTDYAVVDRLERIIKEELYNVLNKYFEIAYTRYKDRKNNMLYSILDDSKLYDLFNTRLLSQYVNVANGEFVKRIENNFNNEIARYQTADFQYVPVLKLNNLSFIPNVKISENGTDLIVELTYNKISGMFEIVQNAEYLKNVAAEQAQKANEKIDNENREKEEIKNAAENLQNFSFDSHKSSIANANSISPTIFHLELPDVLQRIANTPNAKDLLKMYQNTNITTIPIILKSVPVYVDDSQKVVNILANSWRGALRSKDVLYVWKLSSFIMKRFKKFVKRRISAIRRFLIRLITLNYKLKLFPQYSEFTRNLQKAVFEYTGDEIFKPALIVSINDLPDDFTFDYIYLKRFMDSGWGNIYIDDPYEQKVYAIMRLVTAKNQLKGVYVSILQYSALGLIKRAKTNISKMKDPEEALQLAEKIMTGQTANITRLNNIISSSLMKRRK